jgi:hypothetical protein
VVDFTNSAHSLTGSNPLLPISLSPTNNVTVNVSVIPKTNTSLMIVTKNAAGEPLASTSAYLLNTATDFEATKSTGLAATPDFGQVYFGGLSAGVYDLVLNLSGFIEATASLDLTQNQQEIFILNNE